LGCMMMERRDQLEAAQGEAYVVRVTRGSFDPDGDLAYVVATGSELVLLLCISNQIRFDGFMVVRIRDITELEAPHEHSDFVEEALRRRGESVPSAPEVDLTSIEATIRTAAKLHPLLVLHREKVDSEVCHIGAVVNVSSDSVGLLEIDPDAEWADQPTTYALSEVTKLEFGGGYEEALALVGGEPPTVPHPRPVS
jgi:hypothetical protein